MTQVDQLWEVLQHFNLKVEPLANKVDLQTKNQKCGISLI